MAPAVPATSSLPYTVYYGNLHSQTNDSDGGGAIGSCTSSQSPQTGAYGPSAAFAYAKQGGLDFLLTSEHNHMYDASSGTNASASRSTALARYQSGLQAAQQYSASQPGFLALYGMEWGVISGGGHLNIFVSNELYSWDYDPSMDIFSYDEKTGAMKQLTTAKGYDAEAGYSPDGQWIAFSSMRDAYNRTLTPAEQKQLETDPSYFAEVYIMKADGSEQKRLTNWPGYDGGTFFTKDGRIVWRHFEENGLIANVYTMKPDGTDRKQLTDFGSMSWAPYQHPSGEYFIFASNKLGFENFELYMVDIDGTKEPVRVTYSDGFDGLPVPSPDGNRLAWTSTRGGGSDGQIYLAQWNHAKALEALAMAPPRTAAAR